MQVLALDVLQGDELHALGFAEVVNADYIAVSDLSSEDKFLLEALDDGWIASQFRTNDFEGDHAVEFAVFGSVNRAHATFTQYFKYFVTCDQHGARLEGHTT